MVWIKSLSVFNDREVRAVWDEEYNKWWFSATDIIRAINNEEDYVKAGNYWRWLKKKGVSRNQIISSMPFDEREDATSIASLL